MADTRLMNIPQAEIEAGKAMAIIAYFIFFVPLLVEDARKNRFAMYHTEQAILCILANFACGLGIIGVIIGLINAVNGKAEPLPIIGQYGASFNLVKNAEAAQLKG